MNNNIYIYVYIKQIYTCRFKYEPSTANIFTYTRFSFLSPQCFIFCIKQSYRIFLDGDHKIYRKIIFRKV